MQILYFDDCPNWAHTLTTVERIAGELGIDVEISTVRVPNSGAAMRLRFLGSSTVRVDGRDVEPGAARRSDYAFACRVYQTSAGPAGPRSAGFARHLASNSRMQSSRSDPPFRRIVPQRLPAAL